MLPRRALSRGPLPRDRIRIRCRRVTPRPSLFLLLALAVFLAPFGICLTQSAAMAASPHPAAMHHGAPAPAPHSRHQGKAHFCPECQPASFVKAGKMAAPDLTQLAATIAAIPAFAPLPFPRAKAGWNRRAPSRPPPLRGRYRIRLQI